MRRSYISALALATLALPALASAADIFSLVSKANGLVNSIIVLLVAIALAVFFWGLITYILGSKEGDKHKEALSRMGLGIIAFFVMVSVWGLVRFLQNSLGVTDNQAIPVQSLQVGQ